VEDDSTPKFCLLIIDNFCFNSLSILRCMHESAPRRDISCLIEEARVSHLSDQVRSGDLLERKSDTGSWDMSYNGWLPTSRVLWQAREFPSPNLLGEE